MTKNTKIAVTTLAVLGTVSLLKTTKGIRHKVAHERKRLELESRLHSNFRGKKNVRSFVKDLDDTEINALLKVLKHFEIE